MACKNCREGDHKNCIALKSALRCNCVYCEYGGDPDIYKNNRKDGETR